MTVRDMLPESLFTPLGTSSKTPNLPGRVQRLVAAAELRSEQLIGWAQLAIISVFGSLYLFVPKPADAAATMFEPVPLVLSAYFVFTVLRIVLSHVGYLPGWFLVISMLVDVTMLFGLIWLFHLDYGQPAAFYLKIPTFAYIFVFIAIRALRFDPRFVLSIGAFAAIGWVIMVAYAAREGGEEVITRSFTEYLMTNKVLIGAEFDKVFTIAAVTLVIAFAIWRAQNTLIASIRDQAAGEDMKRFFSDGVVEAITSAEDVVEAGKAEARDAAIMFLDIRGFTAFSTDRSPSEVVRMLTGFHARAIPILREHGGVVDKFLGDGIMVSFGAVKPSATAAADALRALEALMAEGERWRAELPDQGIDVPLNVNGAVAAGPIVFAALGHESRLEYTVIGEAANLAAKLEKHNKAEQSRAITTAEVLEKAKSQGYVPPASLEMRPHRDVAGVDAPLDLAIISN